SVGRLACLVRGAPPRKANRLGALRASAVRRNAMIGYICRRLAYGVLVLLGVNVLTFLLFFTVNTPDDMARMAIGGQRISQEAIDQWKVERGYDKPLFYNAQAQGAAKLTDTIFHERSVPLLSFDFGLSDA